MIHSKLCNASGLCADLPQSKLSPSLVIIWPITCSFNAPWNEAPILAFFGGGGIHPLPNEILRVENILHILQSEIDYFFTRRCYGLTKLFWAKHLLVAYDFCAFSFSSYVKANA